MSKITVACFFGGKSAEYSVSLISATSILKHMDKNKYNKLLIGINKNGDFFHYEGNLDNIENDTWEQFAEPVSLQLQQKEAVLIRNDETRLSFDIAFPILHGTNGEDGRIQGMLELMNIKTVGCDMSSSALAMDKYVSKQYLKSLNIKVPKSILINQYDDRESIRDLKLPLFIKPLKAGSSFGISKIHAYDDLNAALDLAFTYDNKVIIEETIDGFEVGCAIIGNEDLTIGAVDEIEISTDFFNFEEKYTLKSSQIHLPARLSVAEMESIKEEALTIYKLLGCHGCARVDMFYTKDKQIVFNEVNTMPGFTSNSRFPNMLKAIGYSFEQIIDDLIELGLSNE